MELAAQAEAAKERVKMMMSDHAKFSELKSRQVPRA